MELTVDTAKSPAGRSRKSRASRHLQIHVQYDFTVHAKHAALHNVFMTLSLRKSVKFAG
jgi:hypothetical protein